jgi:hypothetical protein
MIDGELTGFILFLYSKFKAILLSLFLPYLSHLASKFLTLIAIYVVYKVHIFGIEN